MRILGRLALHRIKKFWQRIIIYVADNGPQPHSLVWGAVLFYIILNAEGRALFYQYVAELEEGNNN